MNWENFTDEELDCQHCGKENPNAEFIELMNLVQVLRNRLGFPLPVASGYRCPDHPIEKAKRQPGQHSKAAVDIAVEFKQAHMLLREAMDMGFTGIGINQKGGGRFIHLDIRKHPVVWSY